MLSEREVDRVMAGFVGRRAFSKGNTGKRGEVFRYEDFVAALTGGNTTGEDKEKRAS
jgi:hypothetical protein